MPPAVSGFEFSPCFDTWSSELAMSFMDDCYIGCIAITTTWVALAIDEDIESVTWMQDNAVVNVSISYHVIAYLGGSLNCSSG